MSQYCTIQAEIQYKDEESFNKALKTLEIGEWVKDGHFIDEMENQIAESEMIERDNLLITIPFFHYRNLGSALGYLFEGSKETSWAIWTTTDGDFQGGVIEGGKEELFDLAKWAKENLEEDDATPPSIEDTENYCEWQSNVESEFFGDMCP